MKKILSAFLAALVVASGLPAPAFAIDGYEELFLASIPVVVTAALKEQKATEAPASVTVITSQDIRERGYRTISDILKDVPGFVEISDTNEEVAAVRGAYATTTNKILTLVNGHRMNDVALGRYNLDQFLGIDIVDRVELIRGAGSVLYGSGALVAVVNIITKRGPEVNGTRVELAGGSFSRQGGVTWGRRKEDMDILFNATYMDAPGERIHQPASKDVAPVGQTPADGVVYWHKYPKNWSAFLSLKDENSILDVRTAHFARVTPRSNNGSFYDYDQELLKPLYTMNDSYVNFTRTFNMGGDAKVKVNPSFHHYQYFEYSYIGAYGANRVPPYGQSRGPTESEFDMAQLKLYYEDKLGEHVDLTAGWDALSANLYRADTVAVNGAGAIVHTPNGYTKPGHWNIYGYLAQLIWTPTDAWSVTLGGRYDTFSGQADPEFTPRAALLFKATEALSFRAIYGNSYLAPQWVHTRSGDPSFLGNPNLDPERFQGLDVIADYNRGPLSLSVNYFMNTIRGLISQVGVEYNNIGKQDYKGVDTMLNYRLTQALALTASHSYIDSEGGTTAAHLLRGEIKSVPSNAYRYGLRLSSPEGKLVWSAWGRTYSHVNVTDTVTGMTAIPSWTTLDTSVTWQATSALDLRALATNVTDKGYEIGQAGSAARPLPRHGIGWELAAGYKF